MKFSIGFVVVAMAWQAPVVGVSGGGNPIFPSDARLEQIFERTADLNSGLTEGPALAPDGSIYFCDLPLGAQDTMIHRFDPRVDAASVFTDRGGKACGLAFDADGMLLACDGADAGGRCIARWHLKTGEKTIVADRFQGKRFNAPNDLCLDRRGRIYFTDPRYLGDEPEELEHRAVYRVDADGDVVEITRDVEMPNGIALSPDDGTLYVGDHNPGGNPVVTDASSPRRGAMRVYAFPLDSDGLVSGDRRTLVDFGKENGSDGILVDAAGHIYIACRSLAKPGVMVIEPDGRQIAFLQTGPENQTGAFDEWKGIPSNMEFGVGEDANTLYITMDKGLYRIRTTQRGLPPAWLRQEERAENGSRIDQ